MCKILGVKRANYYKWIHHEKSTRDLENEKLAEYIIKYHEKYNKELGYRSMADKINKDNNEHYNDKQVYKIMRILGFKSITRPKRKSCTVRKANNTASNLLNRDFNASKPNEKWVTDVTEFKYGPKNENKLYLSAILDLYDRSIISYVLSDSNNNILVFDTFKKAVVANPNAHPLFHSDGAINILVLHLLKCLKIKEWYKVCHAFTVVSITVLWKDFGVF